VSQPKAGKTILLKKIANSITRGYPDVHLMVLLIDERPEEVTDMQRSIRAMWSIPPLTRCPRTTPAWPKWCWSAPSGWWRAAAMW
jgi:hypothetical protein